MKVSPVTLWKEKEIPRIIIAQLSCSCEAARILIKKSFCLDQLDASEEAPPDIMEEKLKKEVFERHVVSTIM